MTTTASAHLVQKNGGGDDASSKKEARLWFAFDFDGVMCVPEDLDSVDKWPNLTRALLLEGLWE